jgi:hypothetical protein
LVRLVTACDIDAYELFLAELARLDGSTVQSQGMGPDPISLSRVFSLVKESESSGQHLLAPRSAVGVRGMIEGFRYKLLVAECSALIDFSPEGFQAWMTSKYGLPPAVRWERFLMLTSGTAEGSISRAFDELGEFLGTERHRTKN